MNSRSGLLSSSLLMLLTMTRPEPTQNESEIALTKEQASAFARLALKGMDKEYPNKPEHVMGGPADVKGPKALHPAFFGCYDWHSSVHGHWMLVRLLGVFPDLPEADRNPRRSERPLDGREPEGRGRLLRPQGEQVVRTAVRLGVAAQAGGGASRLGRPRRARSGRRTSSRLPT